MFMGNKICFILNYGPYYRFPIYNRIAEAFNADFYLGDSVGTPLKKFDYQELKGYKGTLKRYSLFAGFYWLAGCVHLVFRHYDKYVLTGEPLCLSSWILLVLARIFGKKTISWTHGWYGRERRIKKYIKRLYFKLFNKNLCYNEYGARLLAEQGVKRHDIYIIANSLDYDKQTNIRECLRPSDIYRKHFGNDNSVIVYCGRIQKSKKVELLLDLVYELEKKSIHTNLVLVGKDVDDLNLPQLISEKGITQQVWLYGPCYEEETLSELFYNSAVCVSPGNVGLTAIHSLTYGCPVITHNDFPYQGPEFESIVPGKTGDFFNRCSLPSLLEVTRKWINLSNEDRDIIRQNCYKEIDRKWNYHYQLGVLENVLG